MDAQLVDRIVQQVIEALRAQAQGQDQDQKASAPIAPPPAQAATPPASKPAKADDKSTPAWKRVQRSGYVPPRPLFVPPKPAAPDRAEWRQFITAEMLLQRLTAAEGGVIELAANERLTPAAEDIAEKRHLTVRKAQAPAAVKAAPPSADAPAPAAPAGASSQLPAAPAASAQSGGVGLVIVGATPKVAAAMDSLRREMKLVDYTLTDCWMANTLALADAVTSGQVCCGVVLAPYAADAMALAAKAPGIRAVQGTRLDSVAAAVRRFSANLLVVEHAVSTQHEIRSMVRAMCGPRGEPTNQPLMQRLGELEKR